MERLFVIVDLPESKDQDKLLRSATAWQYRRKDRTSSLGKCLDRYMHSKQHVLGKNSAVVDLWHELLPDEIERHCRLTGISKGIVSVEVDPGPYMHEMKLLSGELLEVLKSNCPRAGIKQIKLYARSNINNQK